MVTIDIDMWVNKTAEFAEASCQSPWYMLSQWM